VNYPQWRNTDAETGDHVKAGIDPIIKVMEKMELQGERDHIKIANETTPTTTLTPVETSQKMRGLRRPQLTPDFPWENPTQIELPAFLRCSAKEHLDQIPASRLTTRLELLRKTLRPTPHVQLAMKGMDLFAKLEYVNPVGSIKDRAAYWILRRAAQRGEICEETTVIESSSGNFASALAAFTNLVGLRFIPVIDPNISGTYESFLRRLCPTVVKVEERDDTGGFLKTRLHKVKELCAAIPNAYWTNQYGNLDAMEAHYQLTATEICADFDSLDYVFIGVSTAGTIAGVSRRLKEHYPDIRVIAVDTEGSAIFGGAPRKRHIPGVGSSIVPQMLAYAEIDDIVLISERETVQACEELLTNHGLFVGGSSGTAFAAIKRYAAKMPAYKHPTVLFLCADHGTPYLDTVFNPTWATRLE
jgi:N-(2-amino-2-carboxyethyl)-L-glutamate synthase